jgi:hypothetical protein
LSEMPRPKETMKKRFFWLLNGEPMKVFGNQHAYLFEVRHIFRISAYGATLKQYDGPLTVIGVLDDLAVRIFAKRLMRRLLTARGHDMQLEALYKDAAGISNNAEVGGRKRRFECMRTVARPPRCEHRQEKIRLMHTPSGVADWPEEKSVLALLEHPNNFNQFALSVITHGPMSRHPWRFPDCATLSEMILSAIREGARIKNKS